MATDTGDPSKIEIEIALRDSFSVAFRAMAQEMSAANRKAQESSRGGGGFAELEKMVGSISKSLLGPLGIAGGLYAAARSLDTFAVGQLQMKNFARDTGFAKDEITLMRQQLGTLGVPLAQADQMIGSMGGKLQEAAAIPWGTAMIKMLNDSNPALARQVQQYASSGEKMKALDAIYKDYLKSNLAGQAAIRLATGMSATEILSHGQDVRGLLKPWKDLDVGADEYHKKMMNLDQSFKNIWQSISQNAIKNITEMTGSFESLDKSAHKIAETINEDMNKSFKTLNEYLALYKKLKEHPLDFAADELEDIGRKMYRMLRKSRGQDPDTDDNTTLEFSNKARRPASEELKDLNDIEEDSNKQLRNIYDVLERMESGKPAPGGGGGSGSGGGGEGGGAAVGGPGGPMGRLGDGGDGGDGVSMGAQTGKVKLPESRRETAAVIAEEWRKAGMSEAGIAGLMANIRSESNFDPTLRHPDQPRFGGEAHFAHGLYQEGGTEWNNYAKWLKENHPDGDWKDPRLQSQFAAYRLKTGYPETWKKMAEGTKEQAAEAYLRGYLKPAAGHIAARASQYRRGVPEVQSYLPAQPPDLFKGGQYQLKGEGPERAASPMGERVGAAMRDTGRVTEAQAQVAGIRRQAIDPRLRSALDYAAERTGLQVRVTSGGQPESGPHRTGSHRHDLGRAADFDLVDPETGKTLSRDDPRRLQFLEEASAAGAGGAGTGYMSDPRKIHMGITGSGAQVGRGMGAYAGSREERTAVARGIERSRDFDQSQLEGRDNSERLTEALKKKTADTKSVSGTLSAEVDFKNAAFTKSTGETARFKPLRVTSAFSQNQRAGEGMLYPTDSAHTPWVP